MAEFKLVISDAKGKAVQKEVKNEQADAFINKVIGDKISGDSMGFPGYEFEITGGSDKAGFPMRKDVIGTQRKKILTTHSTGVHIKRKGIRKRKTVAGNTIHENSSQINLKVLKEGKAPLAQAKPEEGEQPEPKEKKPVKKEEKQEEKTEEKKEETEKPQEKEEKPEEKKQKEQKPEKKEAKAEDKKTD